MKSVPLVPCLVLVAALAELSATARPAGAQQFTELGTVLAAPPFPCVTLADYDGDGDLDVMIAGSGKHDVAFTTLYRNDGGTFVDSGIAILGLSRASAAWGDLDGDGDLDLAMTGLTTAGTPTTRVYRNDAGTFVPLAGSFLGVLAGSVAWADVDGDGDLDLMVTGVTSTVAGVGVASTRLYRNDGGTFTSVAHPFPQCYLGGLAWGDFDGDGRPDLAIEGTTQNNFLYGAIFHNDGGGAFTDIGAGLPGDDLGPVAWGDCDHDGDLDLLFGGNSNAGFISRIYRNDGGTFTDIEAGLLPVLWASGAWGDYDNDGDLDVIVSGYDPVAQVPRTILYRNDDGVFVDIGFPFQNLYLGALGWADVDNDGDLDLVIAGNSAGADHTLLYRNNAAVANTAPSAPTGLAASIDGADALLGWGASADDFTPAPGLSYNLRVGTTPGGSQVMSAASTAAGTRTLAALGNTSSDRFARLKGLAPGATYYWTVQAVDAGFRGSPFAAEGSFTFGELGVGEGPGAGSVLHAKPNPFAGATTLHVTVRTPGEVQLLVFGLDGRLARHAWKGSVPAGGLSVTWDGRDDAGRELPAGLYLYRVVGPGVSANGRLTKLR